MSNFPEKSATKDVSFNIISDVYEDVGGCKMTKHYIYT